MRLFRQFGRDSPSILVHWPDRLRGAIIVVAVSRPTLCTLLRRFQGSAPPVEPSLSANGDHAWKRLTRSARAGNPKRISNFQRHSFLPRFTGRANLSGAEFASLESPSLKVPRNGAFSVSTSAAVQMSDSVDYLKF